MNVLIVDDEPIIRIGLRSLVDWEEHGLAYAGEAADGVEAWELLKAGGIDILVTDILMPRMDGLELVRKVKSEGLDTAVVVLSCLDDFDYVKEAMKHGARDYLLKPTMEPEGLVSVLLEAKEALSRSRAEQEQLALWRHELRQSKQAQLGLRLEKFAATGVADEGLEADLALPGKWLYSFGVRTSAANVHRLPEWPVAELHAVVRLTDRTALLLLAAPPSVSQRELHADSFARSAMLHRMAEASGGDSCFVGIGPPVRSLAEFAEAAFTFERQLQRRFYCGGEEATDSREELVPLNAKLPVDERTDLLRAIAAGNADAVLDAVQRIEAALGEQKPAASKVYAYTYELLGLAAGYARDRGLERIEDFESEYVDMDKIQSCATLKQLIRYLDGALRDLTAGVVGAAGLPAGLTASRNPFVRQAIQFMRERYRDNISTSDIADHVRLSRSYLSDLYSKEAGEPLSESLTRIRIEEAKRLLTSGERKVYEVADEVGFQDAKTFAKTFKRVVGCSPKEFEGLVR